jgi:hypothetical protein
MQRDIVARAKRALGGAAGVVGGERGAGVRGCAEARVCCGVLWCIVVGVGVMVVW